VAVIRSTSRSVLAGLVVVAGLALAGCGAGQVSQTAVQSPTIDGISAQVGTMSIRNLALEYPDQGAYEKGSDARLRMVIANDNSTGDTLIAVRSNVSSDVTITAAADGAAPATPTLTAPPPSGTPTATGTASGTPTGTKEPADSSVTGTATTGPSESPSGSASESASGSASATASASASEGPPAQIAIPANGLVSFTGDGPTVLLRDLNQKLYPAQTLQVTLVFQKSGQVTATIAVSAPQGQVSLAPTVTGAPENNTG
jgi:copper(I)-binding protein